MILDKEVRMTTLSQAYAPSQMLTLAIPPRWQWQPQLLLFVVVLLAFHVGYTLYLDHYWLQLQHYRDAAFYNVSYAQKMQWATEYSAQSKLLLFIDGQLPRLIGTLLNLLALVLCSQLLLWWQGVAQSWSMVLSFALVQCLPSTLYHALLLGQLLSGSGLVQLSMSDLNPWSINELWLHLPPSHPAYDLASYIHLQHGLGMLWLMVFARTYTKLSAGTVLALAVLPSCVLWLLLWGLPMMWLLCLG
jgi:hypothetical protein